MIPKIQDIEALNDYILKVAFTDGKEVLYDVKDDIKTLPG